MHKFEVSIEFVIKAETRNEAWQKAEEYCNKHLRGLANVRRVSLEPLPDPQSVIAINEPIRKVYLY